MSNKEISDLVRADILRVLSQRGDKRETLSSRHLAFPEHADYFFGSAEYLQREGLIALGNSQRYVDKGGVYSSAQLTAKGEAFLESSPKETAVSLKNLLVEAFKNAAREKLSDAIKEVPMQLWSTYESWRAS